MSAPFLLANLGAEEGGAAPTAPAARALARLWRSLFDPPLPFSFLEGEAFAWLNTEEAERICAERGSVLAGAPASVVRMVHDKAFALSVARRERMLPAPLDEAVAVLDPELLRDPQAALARITEAMAAWPAERGDAFTLKPRFGTSGRGRIALRRGAEDDAGLRSALPRLAERGGALLEPWLERRGDFSTQLAIRPGEGVLLLGTLEQVMTPAGLPLAHRGTLDSRGRVSCGHAWDEALREAALALALAAADAGYTGPCGVDAFAFAGSGGEPELRPVVELNARFTAGSVALGLARRELAEIKHTLGLAPGGLFPFYLGWDAPAGGWPEPGTGPAHFCRAYPHEPGDPQPRLLVAREASHLEALIGPAAAC